MPQYDRFDPTELKLRDDAEKAIKDAKYARRDVDPGCLGRLRGMEKRFSYALDLDRTAPTQIGIMKQFGDQALKLDIIYDKMIRYNQDSIDIAKKSIDTNVKLMVVYSIVSLGKLCEAILAVLPATSKANEVLDGIKKASGAAKDFVEISRASTGSDAAAKALEASLKQLGDLGGQLADLLGGVLGVKDIDKPDPDPKFNSEKLAGEGAKICQLIKGIAGTLSELIKLLQHETSGSVKLGGGAALLDAFKNLLECYENGVKAVKAYEEQMRLARSIGHMKYHARNLRGSNGLASHASRKAFEHAVHKTTVGQAKLKIELMDFSRAIDNETEARNWGMKLRAQTQQLSADLKKAQATLKLYADLYAAEMAKLATNYKAMLPHQAKLLKAWKAIVDYESIHYTGHLRCDTLFPSHGYLRSELKSYDEALAKAQSRLDLPAAMSEARLRAPTN